MRIKIFCLLIFACSLHAFAQSDYPYKRYDYNFINYDKNKLLFPGDSSEFDNLFCRFDSLVLHGKGKVNIIHIGGSHIQAGTYSGQVRKRLQNFFPGLNGGRGLVFPYRIAKTNNPYNYKITWEGKWTSCKNVQRKKTCSLGLLGISASTKDKDANLKVVFRKRYQKYDFNKVRVFHQFGNEYYKVDIDTVKYNGNYIINEFSEKGFTEILFDSYIDTLYMKFNKTDSIQNNFLLYGISLENDNPGIVYNDVGVNGASIPSFLRCNLFEQQMQQIKPYLVIISLGTNDTYTLKFNPEYYRNNYINLIEMIKKVAPETAILMTVPNDSYYRRRYPNKNTELAKDVILEVAKKYNCGVWNFYEIMGGFNSSQRWYKKELMQRDRIHFTASGYIIKGDMLFNAILKAYDKHLENNVNNNIGEK